MLTFKQFIAESEKLDLCEANFAATMKKAVDAHERGDAKRAAYHLDNARTARYAMKSTEIAKHKELLDQYSKLRDHYVKNESLEVCIEDFSVEELQEFMQTEEYEQLDELSKGTLGSYISKATSGTKGVATQTWVAGGATGADFDAKKKALQTATKRISGIEKAVKRLTKEEEQLDEGGEKHAYRMGLQHGAKGVKKIDAEKSFGVFAQHYHRGYEQGKDSADWHDDKASKAPLSARAKYQESK